MLALLSLAQGGALIVNGSPEPDFPAVVALGTVGDGQANIGCSGSLITPRVVLTAAHCNAESSVLYGKVLFGEDSVDHEASIRLESALLHPDYKPLQGSDPGRYDVALMVLADEAPVAPLRLSARRFSDAELGTTLRSVGYGAPNTGERWSAELVVDGVSELYLESSAANNPEGGQICSGDSGGPQLYFDAERGLWEQWAVHSWGDQDCEQSGSTRMDVVRRWILEKVEEVHHDPDLCEVNGFYDDGLCDPDCASWDGDCGEAPDTGLDEEEGRRLGCTSAPWGAGRLLGLLALAAVVARRRGMGGPERPAPGRTGVAGAGSRGPLDEASRELAVDGG